MRRIGAAFLSTYPLWKLLVVMLVGFTLIVFQFILLVDWPKDYTITSKLFFLNKIVRDFIVASVFIILFYSRHIWLRFVSYLLIFLFTLTYFIQLQSFEITGTYLPTVALENAQHTNSLNLEKIFYSLAIWSLLFAYIISFEQKLIKGYPALRGRISFAVLLLVAAIFVNNDNDFLSEETIDERFSLYNSQEIPQGSPLAAMAKTMGEYFSYLQHQYQLSEVGEFIEIPAEAVKFVYRHYKKWGYLNPEYPLIKEHIYSSPIPFQANGESTEQKTNIIVFFVEGMSARIIQPYSDSFPGLSPNMADFAQHGMQVNNYYNHTYATYRGLGGSLCSTHPLGRLLEETEYYCMPHILNEEGYETQFFFSQRKTKTGLDELFKKAGINQVESYETLFPLSGDTSGGDVLTDRELIDGLILKLKSLEMNKNNPPFFIGLYNFQTHTGIHIRDKESVYRHPNGSTNYLLDTFYNFDRVFGVFWEYFKQSGLYENTAVVVTTDHATFPSRDFAKLSKYVIWADTIPLLIYHPTLDLPKEYNAQHVSSLNLAPSLLHLLGVKNRQNPFLGWSIFDDSQNIPNVMVGAGRGFWYLDNRSRWNRVDSETQPSSNIAEGIEQLKFINFFYNLERAGKIWSRQHDGQLKEGGKTMVQSPEKMKNGSENHL